jgi:putative ABC transport system permease protein
MMSGLLYGVHPTDPFTFGGVLLLVSAVALAASYIPAGRATRIDPVSALRCEYVTYRPGTRARSKNVIR